MIPSQLAIRFFDLILVRHHGLDCVFGVSPSLTVVMAIVILLSKFLRPISMGCGNEISPSENEFDFSLLNNEIISIHKAFNDRGEESSDEDSDEVKGVRSYFGGLEIYSINSYILYNSIKKKKTEKRTKYVKTLVEQLRRDFRQTRNRASTSTSSFDEIRL